MMQRLSELNADDLNPRQRAIYDDILSRRSGMQGPFLAWMHNPELADTAQKLGAYCRFDSNLPHMLSELAILVVARHWRAQVEWAIHAPIAEKAGISAQDIATILAGNDPAFDDPDAQLVYDYVKELLQTARVCDETHRRAVACLGENGVVDLVGVVGYYGLVALTLNAFAVPLAPGAKNPFSE